MLAAWLQRARLAKLALSCYLSILTLVITGCGHSAQQSEPLALKTEPFYLDLYHKFHSDADFTPRGSILVRPKTDYRPAQASIVSQNDLKDSDLKLLKSQAGLQDSNIYHLKAVFRGKKSDKSDGSGKTSESILNSCSLITSNLNDYISVNLNALNEFININLFTSDPECTNTLPSELSTTFNTTVLIDSGAVGPQPDTATYIKRLEEERQNKAKEGKEDNRSFLAKYWMYIVPGVIILMMLGGPEQGAR